MTIESVDILVVEPLPSTLPLEGVVVKVMNEAGTATVTQVTTDGEGIAQLALPTGTYQARFYKFGVMFSGALLLEVLAAPETNQFIVNGKPHVYPEATDPRLCVASGYFRTPSGAAAKSVDVHFIAKWSPILLEGAAVMPERVLARTSPDGYLEVTLIRFGQYDAVVQGMEDYQRTVSVPDSSSVNVGDLLFPVVSAIVFDEPGPFTLARGDRLELHPHVYTSDGNELPNIASDVLWSTTDGTRLAVVPGDGVITLIAIEPGSYELRAERKDASVIRIPNTAIYGVPVAVEIT